ncbi:MAG: phosphoribulokinase [Sinimarinibacterium flocculans]|uniref:phosphoribulokinase n=1 Tax=Sinimarinibacterium flocculans TaxID=985250 RepID=A0A318EDV4_9GAMM|nr:phosphoribulokinase [Sinimarinibacterium flocculans]MEC9362192.1 phosphoribulokinase [Pseudomonadota bacterium]PXV70683.1 phosphoribulokinase [Sinimarinibacterium flocculans]
MSVLHPIVGITGSSGAGTSTAVKAFMRIFEQLHVKAAFVEGDAFHAYDREQLRRTLERARIRGENFSLFGPSGNLLERLEQLLREYGDSGTGTVRHYLHLDSEAEALGQPVGTFTPWERLPEDTHLLFYEGLHGGYVGEDVNIARHMDLLVGVVPVINLEWIQKIRRDTAERGYLAEEVRRTILRRMPDYVDHIVPQYSRTDVNFQRVPLVDTSNPLEVREIPSPEESLVVIHFNEHSRVRADFDLLLSELPGAFQSHAQTVVVPGLQQERALELIVKPMVVDLLARRDSARPAA